MFPVHCVALPASNTPLPPTKMPLDTGIGPAEFVFLTQRLQGVTTLVGKPVAPSVSMMRLPSPPTLLFEPKFGPLAVTIVDFEYTPKSHKPSGGGEFAH